MLKIRLTRIGKKKRAFFRIVLTEHTKPAKSGYKEVLGRFNPLQHEVEADSEKIIEWIGKGAQPSERVAKILAQKTKNPLFEKFFEKKDITREVRRPDKHKK